MNTRRQESERQTGRTTRMLHEAIRLEDTGHRVVVLCWSHAHADTLREYLDSHFPGTKVRTLSMGTKIYFDEHNCCAHVLDSDEIVLIDHSFIEQRYAPILRELHRYDV